MVTEQEPQEPQEVTSPIETPVGESTETETPQETTGTESVEGETQQEENIVSDGKPVATPSATPSEPSPQEQPAPQQPQMSQYEINELNQRRNLEQERTWKEKTGRVAKAYEQQLTESGYMPEQARDQARRYIQQEQKFKKQEEETSSMLGYVQGKQAAAVHFMKQNGLANKQMLDDLMALQQTNSPQEMEKEAKRMKRERELVSENARLKQGRVSPQTFDNSQGAAEATTNDDRLLQAYIRGDKSEAARMAARRKTIGV
jgi:hypothetical protein